MSIRDLFLGGRRLRLIVSPQTFDELAGMIEQNESGELDMDRISLIRGEESAVVLDPLAAHRARVLAPKGHPCD